MPARKSVLTLILFALLFPSVVSAQEEWFPAPRFHAGVDFIVGEPLGEFQEFVGSGFGADAFGRIAMDPRGILSLRADLGFLVYGYESQRVCFQGIGCRVQARLETTNGIAFGGIGPELAFPMKRARPYVHAFMGFSYFNTSSSLEDLDGYESSFDTENFADGTTSFGWGGGIELNLKEGRAPISLNLGFRYHENGRVEYLTEGDIVDNPDGSITMYPVLSEANLMAYHFGVSIGIPRGRKDDGRHH